MSITARRQHHLHDGDEIDLRVKAIKERTEELLERNNAERAKFSDFMKRLRETAETHKRQIAASASTSTSTNSEGVAVNTELES